MAIVTMKNLLESGVHFGHQTKRWDPRMAKFIYAERNGIHIIDLQKTTNCIVNAYEAVQKTVAAGKSLLFVGTKKQAQEAIQEQATRCEMFYVNNRWLGGMLTNFVTIKQSLLHLKKLEKMESDGTYDSLTKKEVTLLNKERAKLELNLGGIKEMQSLPGILFVVDTRKEAIAVAEAQRMNIPVIAVLDTNANPRGIQYPIPGNDDAIRSISLFTEIIANAVLEAESKVGLQVIENMNVAEELESEAAPATAEPAPATAEHVDSEGEKQEGTSETAGEAKPSQQTSPAEESEAASSQNSSAANADVTNAAEEAETHEQEERAHEGSEDSAQAETQKNKQELRTEEHGN